jgi:uncharacterized protein (TIRG00374 family)
MGIKIIISFTLIGFLIWTGARMSVWQKIQSDTGLIILGCMVVLFMAQVLSSLRWQWILKSDKTDISFKTLLESYMVGMFVNNFLPTTIGGDLVKSYDIFRITKNVSISIISVFLERFSGLVALVMLSWLGAVFLLPGASHLLIGVWLLINIFCIFIAVSIFYEPITKRIIKLPAIPALHSSVNILLSSLEKLNAFKNQKLLLLKLLVVSFPIQLITILIYKIISMSLSIDIGSLFLIFSVPLIILISLLPISYGGHGVREVVTVFMFSLAGVPKDIALGISLIYLSVILLVSLSGGFFLILRIVKSHPDPKAGGIFSQIKEILSIQEISKSINSDKSKS